MLSSIRDLKSSDEQVRFSVAAIVVVALYIFFQVISDITATKVVLIAGMAVGAGFFIYPVTFTLRDMVHKVLGTKLTAFVVLLAGVFNVVMVLIFQIYLAFPVYPNDAYQVQVQNAALIILGVTWRIVFGSITAEILSEYVDTGIYLLWKRKFGHDKQWGRVLLSNFFAGITDVVIFSLIAYTGLFSFSMIVGIIFTEVVVVRTIMSVISIPLIYTVSSDK